MAEYTYPVIVKPMQGNNGVLGIEYWFPDFEECEHILYEDINDDAVYVDMQWRLFLLCTGRIDRCEHLPTPKWYRDNDIPLNAELRFVSFNTNALPEYAEEKEKNTMGYFRDKDIGNQREDAVNHPQHYTRSGIECIDAIDSLTGGYERPGHGYYAGQVLKYLWRAPFKGHYLQDLEKAQWYLNRLVKKVQDEANHGN